jgi:SAM-dependent methyltransferase
MWSNYNWRESGEEWSAPWGGTFNLWYGTLLPRIASFLGKNRAVEIGPGHGRLTAYLKDCCSSLVLVDLAPNCIASCRERFRAEKHLEYFVNDGASLSFLDDCSVDFVFSFDALVHTDLQDLNAYLAEIERVLRIGGAAVLHHSNLASVLQEERPEHVRLRTHLRARDVDADRVLLAASGLETLECRTQELLGWDESALLIDCISCFVRCRKSHGRPPDRFANPDFYLRARELAAIAERYSHRSRPSPNPG